MQRIEFPYGPPFGYGMIRHLDIETLTTSFTESQPNSVALLGFGEAGAAFAQGWRSDYPELIITAFDLKTDGADAAIAAKKWQAYAAQNIKGGQTPAEALADSSVVFSLVTADKASDAASTAAKHMPKNALYFDCNSCAPETKRAASRIMEAAGICYVDTAVMSPVHPKLHHVPLLVSGPHIEKAICVLENLGMKARAIPGDIGRASTIKMMRSVMIKGMEALTLECFLAARKAGVETEILDSLDGSFPGFHWAARAAYNMERSASHGLRRAEEMHEVAKTVASLGLNNGMSQATAHWQHMVGDLDLAVDAADLTARADAILGALDTHKGKRDP